LINKIDRDAIKTKIISSLNLNSPILAPAVNPCPLTGNPSAPEIVIYTYQKQLFSKQIFGKQF
jgi:hypothetical protein